jgi:hypothetical protein
MICAKRLDGYLKREHNETLQSLLSLGYTVEQIAFFYNF